MATIPANNNTGLYNTSGVPAPTNNNITVSGNVNANNFNATSQVNAGTNITAQGNITAGGYFIGDGSLLTNIDAGNIIGGYGNANVANYLESGTVSSNVITTANVTGGNIVTSGVVSAGGNVRGANLNTVGVVSAAGNITGSYILGNGAFLTGLATYGNANVAAFLPTYTGNLAGGNGTITNDLTVGGTIYGTFSGNISGNLVVPGANTQVIYNNSGNAGASSDFTFNNSTKVMTVNGNVNATAFNGSAAGLTSIPGANVTGTVALANAATYAGTVTTAAQPNITSVGTLSSLSVTGNIDGGNINTPGLVQAQRILSNSSIDAGTSMSAASMNATTFSASGNIIASGYFIGDGSLLTGLPSGYSNAQVAAYLASGTNTSNIITTGNVSGTYILGNGSLLTGLSATYGDSNVTTLLAALGSNVISSTGNITTTANISGAYILGNGSQLTGLGATYGNANVSDYLASGTNTANIITTGNIQGGNLLATSVVTPGSTGNLFNIAATRVNIGGVASNINIGAPNSFTVIGNTNTYTSQGNVTSMFVGNNTAIYAGFGTLLDRSLIMNNGYYDAAGTLRTRNTGTSGIATLNLNGTTGFLFGGASGNTTANASISTGLWATISSAGLSTSGSIPITSGGGLTVGSGQIGTGVATCGIFNTATTTLTIGNAATTFNLGAPTVSTIIGGGTGNLTLNNVNAVGVKATGAFTGSFTDGIVADYVTGNGRISVGTADGINFYNSGIGNVSLATLSSTGAFSATGNITAPYFIGNGSQLTGIVSSYGNTNVAAYLASGTNTSNIITTGNVTAGYISTSGVSGNITGANYINANYFVGNGSLLTGIASTYGDANVVTLLGAFGSNTISTTGTVTAGNITGGNVLTGGLVSATGTITSAANVTGGNINTAGIVSATSNITGGNLTTTGVVSATSLTANTQIGNLLLLNQQIQTTQASNVGLTTSLSPNPGRVYLGSGYNGNTSPAYDLTNYGRSGRLVISDSISITDPNSLYRGLAIQNYYTLNGNINSTNTRIGGLVTGTIVGGGPSANTVAGGALAVAGTVNTVTIGGGTSGNLTALGNTTAQYATGMYGTITVNAGSTGGNLNGMVGSLNNGGTANTVVGVAAQLQGAGTFSGNVFAFFNPSATNNTGLTNSNAARAASNYYFLWNDDAVAQNRLGSLRAYHTYQYSTATTGTVNIDKNNGQTQFINPTGNVTIGDFQNFVTTAFDSVNNDNQSDIVTLIIEQGATPYAITMPTGNASIRYANGNSTVPATANSTVTISIQGYRSAANAAAYITTISPGYN